MQDIARGVTERSEKWSVKQALVEVRKNVQGYQQQQQQQRQQQLLAVSREEELVKKNRDLWKSIEADQERQRQLARVLEFSMDMLGIPGDQISQEKALERMRHVKECLLDPAKTLSLSLLSSPSASPKPKSRSMPTVVPKAPIKIPSSPPPDGFVRTSFMTNSDPDFLARATIAHRPRASLAQSSFAWMLGDDPLLKTKSGFVSNKPVKGSEDGQDSEEGTVGKTPSSDPDEGFTLNTLKKGEIKTRQSVC